MQGSARAISGWSAAMALAGLLSLGAHSCEEPFETLWDPSDPLLHLDYLIPGVNEVAPILPFAPWVAPGADLVFGTSDDVIAPELRGDIDLVLRSGRLSIGAAIPPPSPFTVGVPRGSAEPLGHGVPIDFVVVPSDGTASAPYGQPAAPAYLEGLPFLVVVFADLDADGYVGITHLDGDAADATLEEAEFAPVGWRYALAENGVASGQVVSSVGGPFGAPAWVALTAVTFAGPISPGYEDGLIPDGPGVATRLPYLPWVPANLEELLEETPLGAVPATLDGRVIVRLRVGFRPDPADARVRESFTLRLTGAQPTIDIAFVHSGEPVRFGAAQDPDPSHYRPLVDRPLRPGLAPSGQPAPVEVLTRLWVRDDGAASQTELRVIALDLLGNVSSPTAPTPVTLRTGGVVRIVTPDEDGDPYAETVVVSDARGAQVVLDDPGSAFDDVDFDFLVIDDGAAHTRVDVLLPDPDVNDSGVVDSADVAEVSAAVGAELGRSEADDDDLFQGSPRDAGDDDDDISFDPKLDVDGNGRIEQADVDLVSLHLGASVPTP